MSGDDSEGEADVAEARGRSVAWWVVLPFALVAGFVQVVNGVSFARSIRVYADDAYLSAGNAPYQAATRLVVASVGLAVVTVVATVTTRIAAAIAAGAGMAAAAALPIVAKVATDAAFATRGPDEFGPFEWGVFMGSEFATYGVCTASFIGLWIRLAVALNSMRPDRQRPTSE